jgi:chromosome segregation ATPase
VIKLDELMNLKDNYQRIIDGLDKLINEEKEVNNRLKNEIENKDAEFVNVRRELDRLGSIYESKIEVLNNKINLDKDKIYELKNEIKLKNEHFSEANNINSELKVQIKSVKGQLEGKLDEINNLKKEYEKLLLIKERRINELQGLINQSYISYNSGVNNIKIANKLDDEIKSMMKKLNIDRNLEDNQVNQNTNNILNTNSGTNSDYKKKK